MTMERMICGQCGKEEVGGSDDFREWIAVRYFPLASKKRDAEGLMFCSSCCLEDFALRETRSRVASLVAEDMRI